MADNKQFLELAELGLEGDKQRVIKYLQHLAAKAIKSNRHTFYNALVDLINKYSTNYQLSESSFLNERPRAIEIPENIWVSSSTERKLTSFVEFYKNKKNFELGSLNHLNKVLLYGPPGTGKTTLGFYIARLLKKDIKYVKISDIVSSKFGETLKNFSEIFANTTEEIIFIDEFDAFAKSRSDTNDVGELKRIVNSIIQTLDFQASHKMVLVATNLIDSIDTAILRRFPFKIFVGYLDEKEKQDFFHFLLKAHGNLNSDINSKDVNSILTFLELNTVDEIKTFFEKTLINLYINKETSFSLDSFIDTIFSEGYINKERIKKLKKENPELLKKIAGFLENKGYTKIKIAELLGIHRNSYNKYIN